MFLFGVVTLGIAAVLGLSLVLKLRSIRTRGFGEGTPLSLPEAGLEMRHPHWWKPFGAGAGAAAGATSVATPPERGHVILRTGHSRGVLRITAWGEDATEDETALRSGLTTILREQGLELDDPEITISPIPHPPRKAPLGLDAWVASGGRQASRPEERTYFEVHLVALGGARVLFSYTNSVLQGFLDAYYLEKVLETLHPARHEP